MYILVSIKRFGIFSILYWEGKYQRSRLSALVCWLSTKPLTDWLFCLTGDCAKSSGSKEPDLCQGWNRLCWIPQDSAHVAYGVPWHVRPSALPWYVFSIIVCNNWCWLAYLFGTNLLMWMLHLTAWSIHISIAKYWYSWTMNDSYG